MSLYKIFKPTEKMDVQFRTEAFNVFNHTRFSFLNSSVATDFFMRAEGPIRREWSSQPSKSYSDYDR